MSEISLDFSSIPEFVPIPPGDYLVEVIEVIGPRKSQAGNNMLELKIEICEGEFQGRKVGSHFLLLEGDAMWRTKKDLAVLLGVDEEAESARFNPEDLLGANAIGYITGQIWKEEDGGDGEARPRVSRLKAVGGVADLFE